jgi:hypothetical protein
MGLGDCDKERVASIHQIAAKSSLLGNWAGCGITCSRKYAVRGGVDEPPRLLPHEEVTHEEVKPSG